jgi:hypothetical protein
MAGDFFMRICWRGIAGVVCLSLASLLAGAEEIESDVFASMAGKCNTLTIAERNFTCASMAFSHSPGGRSAFTVPLNDPEDENHIVTFSGENGQREQDSLYVLAIDRVLLKSKDSAKAGGLPIPFVEPSTGKCTQVGNFAMQRVSSVACVATDGKGTKYELQFESDGSPIKVKAIRLVDPETEERRARTLAAHVEQIKCRNMADVQDILPRDRTEFILRCMEQ